MTLLRAMAVAGGTTEFSKLDDVVIFRTVQGERLAALYDLNAIRHGKYADPDVYANDVVMVGDSSRAAPVQGPLADRAAAYHSADCRIDRSKLNARRGFRMSRIINFPEVNRFGRRATGFVGRPADPAPRAAHCRHCCNTGKSSRSPAVADRGDHRGLPWHRRGPHHAAAAALHCPLADRDQPRAEKHHQCSGPRRRGQSIRSWNSTIRNMPCCRPDR